MQVTSPNVPESRCVVLTVELCAVVDSGYRPGTIRSGLRSLKYQRHLIHEPLPEFLVEAAMCFDKRDEESPSRTLTTGKQIACDKREATTAKGLDIQ